MSEPGSKPCILVVDDDSSVLVSLALLLKQSGFEVLTCDDPGQVPGLLASRRVDLVLQDMNFSPQTSGEEGLALLADTKARQPALPVLLMTAWGSIQLAVRGVKAGAALLSIAVMVLVSVGCALYPAWRATRISPTEALHYE